ncbi:DUF2087 domain-containing protein [Paenibacillus tianjinensis]|uniref:DUF2087 domain-containing protein n=1 Tax=Paenibacillus tianjinensis TaxID=2810347 RepID=A0ABX7L6V1_9BACL|nr:DUF2087 domain-containing protein [Paenibacillus tianjinensis]QSF43038.1 DUF2087 domain-containing protein [Paenibacillus tianjinensis]
MKSKLDNFLDCDRKLRSWPAKRTNQRIVVEYLSTNFADGVEYTEAEVNEIIKDNHTFNDHCFLRRELVDSRLLGRTSDGRKYWKIPLPEES